MQRGEGNAKGKIRPKVSKITFEQDPSSGDGCQCHIPGVRQVPGVGESCLQAPVTRALMGDKLSGTKLS